MFLMIFSLSLSAYGSGVLTTLVKFNGANGSGPEGDLVLGADGNFYGTTRAGGRFDQGTVFKVSPSGVLSTLVHFNGSNGSDPAGSLVQGRDGNFYGTTRSGGAFGLGTVFRVTLAGATARLVDFNDTNGAFPDVGLVQGRDGNFYGTTRSGGAFGLGTVFRVTFAGELTSLVDFNGFNNGDTPLSALVEGPEGGFYGTTGGFEAGFNTQTKGGTIFEVSPQGAVTDLWEFGEGQRSISLSFVQEDATALYGVAVGTSGEGASIFYLDVSGDQLVELYSLDPLLEGVPFSKLLFQNRYLYGTAATIGSEATGSFGTIFALDIANGEFKTLATFEGQNGSFPSSGLVRGLDGKFYGTTSGLYDGVDHGTIFSFSPRLDSDGDGLIDVDELRIGTNPQNADTDGDGLSDGREVNVHKTDPKKADTDGDGLSDGQEVNVHKTDPKKADTDGDGLSDGREVDVQKTDPKKADTDGDGMPDGWEVANRLDPLRAADALQDNDKDGLTNLAEYQRGTSPNKADTDGDQIPDGWEVAKRLNPLKPADALQDNDKDGLTNLAEYQRGTDPWKSDTDGDGLIDGQEVNVHKTDPKKTDTDGDQIPDGWEVAKRLNPLKPADALQDNDKDGLTNLAEYQRGTNPNKADTDGDQIPDGWEVAKRLNPLKPADALQDDDKDGLTNLAEYQRGTDPNEADTDGDGYDDAFELNRLRSNPSGPNDVPTFTAVRDPKNPDEDNAGYDLENAGLGYVGQVYEIGITEVTNLMYAKFLNAVAKTDSLYGLYTTLMGTDEKGGIVRSGTSGRYVYKVKPGFENRPVNFVSLYDALRYINWLHNGMPATGRQDSSTTENGAYKLLGANPRNAVRNAGADYFLPDQDEWHKAAFFDPNPGQGRPSDSYWPYADRTTSGPGGNFSTSRVNLVATSAGPSRYGTYDQGGNVIEWTESVLNDGERLLSGGRPMVSDRTTRETADVGFRVGRTVRGSLVTPLVVPALVPVREEFNLGDDTNRNLGRVVYDFQMGKYEVTNEEYAAFLNAVAKTDSFYGLYNTRMGTDPQGGIMRSGRNGNFKYTLKRGFAKKPVNFVTVYSAMRFCNWLHNGAQPGGEIETGAYRLLGSIPADTVSLQRNASARFFLPTEDEWYKAAFYDPSPAARPTASYWAYAVKSDTASESQINFSGTVGGLTAVDKPGLPSFFGTFGQSGNVAEWTESLDRSKLARIVRGGHYASSAAGVSSVGSADTDPLALAATTGFRIAAAPDVSSPLESVTDRIKPQVKIDLPASGSTTTKAGQMAIKGRATDNVAATRVDFRVKAPGSNTKFGPWQSGKLSGQGRDRPWTAMVALPRAGVWQVQVRAVDAARNSSAVADRTLVVDRTMPTLKMVNPAKGAASTRGGATQVERHGHRCGGFGAGGGARQASRKRQRVWAVAGGGVDRHGQDAQLVEFGRLVG